MRNRIDATFARLKKDKKKALLVYITAGDPSLGKTEQLILSFEKQGVDLIEIGVPFSDPLADGPVIQEASNRALLHHTNLKQILALVRRLRKRTQIPLLLMSYINPILHYGPAKFAQEAKKSGVDGLIIPDLPLDEGVSFNRLMRKNHIHVVLFLAPTSSKARQEHIARNSSGFIYFVSLTGVTGAQKTMNKEVFSLIRSVQSKSKGVPVCLGFGISNPAQAKKAAKTADGVIVGSAIVKALASKSSQSPDQFSKRIVAPFVRAVKGAL